MRVHALLILAITVAVQSGGNVRAQSPSLKSAMQLKVDSAERLLRPIVTADFALIDRYSERLSQISYTEINSWNARPETGYSQRATMFLTAVQRLRKAAVAKRRDDAVAGYTALIQSCADCHQYVERTAPISFQESRP